MNAKQLADEFKFLREKIEKVCTLMIQGSHSEAAFMLGCLHSICHNHSLGWKHVNNMQNPPPVSPVPPVETQADEPAV
jgi:hypothetical protein